MILATCILCGKEFTPKTKTAKICYDDHYKVCPVCGKTFKLSRDNYKKKTCSPECSRILRKKDAEITSLEKYGVKNAGYSASAQSKIKATNLAKYGSEHYFESEKAKKKNKEIWLEKYGVDNPMKVESIQEKAKHTCLEKYGDSCPLGRSSIIRKQIDANNLANYGIKNLGGIESSIEKAKQTHFSKYGMWYSQTEEYINKKKQTCIEKYGVEHPMKCKRVKQNLKSSFINSYGVDSPMKVESIKDKLHNTIKSKYGVDWACQLAQCREASGSTISKINVKFQEDLNLLGIDSTLEFPIGRYSYDLKIDNSNILIELNPTYTHTCEMTHFGGVSKLHHYEKSKLASDSGFRCIVIWDWDDKQKIMSSLCNKKTVYGRNTKVVELSTKESRLFLNKFHFQNACNGISHSYGLVYNDEIVSLMTFGKPRYNKSCDIELLRYCANPKYSVIGGAEKLYSHLLSKTNPNRVVSYCDLSKFTGNVYRNLNFELKDVSIGKHWSKNNKHITSNLLLSRGYDQLFNTNYGKGTSNEDLMLEHGWLPIWDCGQATYIWER